MTHRTVQDNKRVKYYPDNLPVRRYIPDKDFIYVRTLTLTSEILLRHNHMTYPKIEVNNRVKYHPYLSNG